MFILERSRVSYSKLQVTYSVVIEIFLIIVNLIYLLISNNFEINILIKYVGFTVVVFFMLHILIINNVIFGLLISFLSVHPLP